MASKISQYFHFEKTRKKQNKTYRIIGQKTEDPNRISVNSNVIPTLIYNEATARFHQWRAQGTVYGLNFASTDQVSDFLQNSDRKKHLQWLLEIRSPVVSGNKRQIRHAKSALTWDNH